MSTSRQSAFPCINKTNAMVSINSDTFLKKSNTNTKSRRRSGSSFGISGMDPCPRCLPTYSVWTIFLFSSILIASLFQSTTASLPFRDPETCGPLLCKAELDTKEENTEMKFHYKGGSIYSYQYVVNGTTVVLGGPPTQSGLHLSAKVTIRFLTACDAILFVKETEVWQSYLSPDEGKRTSDDQPAFKEPKSHPTFIKSLEQFPLRFSYGDGLIEEICPHSEESSWALNIKRGFLSAFQNTMRRLDLEHKGEEDDVHGKCKVQYTLGTATSSALTIEKVKDLKSCGDKFGILSSIQGTPYNFGTLHQSMPAVVSTSECEHIVDRNLLSKVRCSESHRLQSLARGVSGTYTNIRQSMELVEVYVPPLVPSFGGSNSSSGLSPFDEDEETEEENEEEEDEAKNKQNSGQPEEERGNAPWLITRNPDSYTSVLINKTPEIISRRESLLFRHDFNLGRPPSDFNTAQTLLSDFCKAVKSDVESKAGSLFTMLVMTLRGLSFNEMMRLSKDAVQLCQNDRNPFDDILEAVGTSASVGVIKERILRREATSDRISSWINSLTFIPKPDLALLNAAVILLKARDDYPNILLTLSSLTHSYCAQVGQDFCLKQQPVAILAKLYDKYFGVTVCGTKKRRDADQALMYLKGIGNFGMYTEGISNALQTCIRKNDKNEIRVAALEAYRRMPCESQQRDTRVFNMLFENQAEDSEIRIAAFLSIMRCPSYPTIRWVRDALDREEVNQVGSFVWTYLTNLQETSLPSKAELQALLQDETLSSKFTPDVRKFSRNFELSSFYEDANLGIGVDGNLIFSQTSYLPRSASVNLTVDLFGESVNVLESTLRVESLEHYVESIFGPNGKLSKPSNLSSSVQKGKRRVRRATPSKRKIRTLSLEHQAAKRYYADPIASLSFRAFGNEIYYKRMVGLGEQMDIVNKLNPFKAFSSLGNQKDTNWQKSRMLLDSAYIIPTGVGFPLNLSAQASSIMRFETESVIDSSADGFKLRGKLIPSVLLTVAGSMTLSVSDIHSGMKIQAHLRSSTAVEGTFHIQRMNLLDVEFGLPKNQLEILQYRSDVMFMDGDDFRPVGEVETGRNPLCTAGLFHTYLGLRLCSSSFFSLHPSDKESKLLEEEEQGGLLAPYFPLNGPSYFTLTFDKANPSLLKTRFNYVWNNNQTATVLTLMGTTFTGESRTSPATSKLGLDLKFDKANRAFQLDMTSVSDQFKASGQLPTDLSRGDFEVSLHQNLSPVFVTSASFKKTVHSTGKSVVKPSLTVHSRGGRILEASGDLEITPSNSIESHSEFTGKGELVYSGKQSHFSLDGIRNTTTLAINLECDFWNGETLKWSSVQRKLQGKDESRGGLHSQLTLELSASPQYNTAASWKLQTSDDGWEHEGEFSQGPNYMRKGKDTSNLWIRVGGLLFRSHEGSRNKWLCLVKKPSEEIDWGFEASLNTVGKSLDTMINLRYAPEKTVETSLSVKRSPGLLTHAHVEWNITIPNYNPLQVAFNLEEKAHRTYQAQFKTDWFRDRLILDFEYTDRSRKTKVDTSISLGVTTTVIDNLKLSFHCLSDDKETKINFDTDYKNKRNTFELGHSQGGRIGRKHKLHASLSFGDLVYLVMTEVDLENGFQCVVKTDLGSKFSDIYARARATNQNGMQIFSLEYGWDATRDRSKKFLLECSMDASRRNIRRTATQLILPRHEYQLSADYQFIEDERSGSVSGKVSWKKDEDGGHLHLNGRLGPRRRSSDSDDEAYDAVLQVATPFPAVKNVSLNLGLDLLEERSVWKINFDGSWGDDGRLRGTVHSRLEPLSSNEVEEDEIDNDNENLLAPHEEENEILPKLWKKFKFRLEGNITSSVKNYEVVNLRLNHIHHSFLNLKTDVDIQFPKDKEINLSTQWVIPQTWSDILSTRVEVHFKSPFVGFQNFDAQVILGRKEDRDVLAIIGIYFENFQYAISITGTPRFKEDGTLGFEVITSNPNSDKIFGSFSYVIGDNARIACQLGWPQVVIGLEAGYEWAGWEEFHIYFTSTSPWMPAKHLDARVKVDGAQLAEFKLELNEDTIDAKSEWAVVSWANFDIRFNANSPFEDLSKIGFILRNSWDDEVTYHSQCMGWVNDQQVGYKLEGGTTDVEEAEVTAIVMHSQVEIDTIVYPTVRGVFSFTTRDARFNIAASVTLREGPINIEGQLDLLDVFRFNENVTITTPYPGLFELELNLSPAIVFEKDLYNLLLQSKWRSGSEWYEGGLVIRAGPQGALSDILTQEAQDALDLSEPPEGEEEDERQEVAARVEVPMSQLVHFYSPLAWAKIIKVEYETVEVPPSSPTPPEEDADNGGDGLDEDLDETGLVQGAVSSPTDVFPIRNFIAVYSANVADLSAVLHNEELSKKVRGVVDVRVSPDLRVSLKLDGALELSEPERKFSFVGGSYWPRSREYSLETSWTNGLPGYLQGKTEIKTPLEEWEEQQASVMYAHNEDERSYSVDFELTSLAFDKVATNVALTPRHFSMTLNTPFQGLEEVELRGDTTSKDDSDPMLNTLINIKSGEKGMEIDVDSSIDDQGWPTQIQGSLSTTFGLEAYRQGDLKADVNKSEDGVNVNGEIEWKKNNQRVRAILLLSLPRSRFQELNITVDTPFKHLENWNVWLHQDSAEDQFSVQLQAATPLSHFSTLEAKGILEYETSLWKVKQLGLRVKAPLGSAQIKSNWTLSKWNDFDLGLESKYALDSALKADFPSLDSLQTENGLRCDIANFIVSNPPSRKIDSRANFQIAKPSFRVGGGISSELIDGESFTLKLSSDYGKTHYKAGVTSEFDEGFQHLDSQVELSSSGPNSKMYNSNLKWRRETESSVDGELKVEWGSGGRLLTSVQSTFNCSWPDDNDANFHLRVGPPSSSTNTNTTDTSLISIDGSSNRISSRHTARFQFGQDGLEERPLRFDADLMLQSLQNFATTLNLSSSIESMSDLGAHLSNRIDGSIIDGVIGGNWETDKLLLDYYWDYEKSDDLFKVNSSLEFEVPVATESTTKPQTGFLMLYYQSESQTSASEFKVVYNGVELGNGSYSSESEESAGLEKVDRHVTFANHFWPFGLDSHYEFEYSGGYDGLNLPTKTVRRLEVYDLGQADLHKLEGELQIKTNFTGREITVTGKHPSKELQFFTDYDFLDHQFKHKSRISWSPDSSVAYELGIMNRTNGEKTEHELDFRLTYPIRMITLHSGYIFEGSSLNWTTEMNFNASKSDRKLVGILTWSVGTDEKASGSLVTGRRLGITLRHPSLLQDLRAEGQLQTDGWDLIEGKVWMDYTGDLNKGVTLVVRTQPEFWKGDDERLPYWNVSTDIRLHHSATNLDLKTLHSTRHSPHELSIITLIDFKNSKKSLAQESKIAFELFKQLRKAHIMMMDPEDHLKLEGQVSGQYPKFVFLGGANYTGVERPPETKLSLDLDKPFLKVYAVHGKDLTDGFYAEGGVIDSRNVRMEIWEHYDNLSYSDVSYFLRMNHSKLITSRLKWRPELFAELKELGKTFYRNVSRIMTEKSDHIVSTVKTDAWESMNAIWDDAKGQIEPFLMELREECDFRNDSAALQFFFEEMQRQNDYYVQDILGFTQLFLEEISMRITQLMEKLKTYREGGSSESFKFMEKTYMGIVDKIQALYNQVVTSWNKFWSNPWPSSEIISMAKVKEYAGLVLYYSVGFVVKLSGEIYGALSSLATSVLSHLGRMVERYQPEVLTYIHQLKAFVQDFIVKVSEYIQQTKEDVMKSPYYQKLATFMGEVKKLYTEISEADATTNIKKYYAMIKTFLHAKLKEIDEFVIPLGQLGTKLQEIWEKVRTLEWIVMIQDCGTRWWNKMKWIIAYTNLDETLQDLLVILYTKGNDLFSQTALEAGGRHQNAKTKFVFDADKGIISLEQKLPMPWAAFNETPDFQRLPEVQYLVQLQDWFGSSKGSIWDVYYKIRPFEDIRNWLPPFDGHAMLVGHEFFFTFDGLAYNFTGSCVYLLAADLVDGNFSVSLQYNNATSAQDSGPSFSIIITAGPHKNYNTLIIDMDLNGLRDGKRGSNQILNLPVQMQNLQGFRDGERLVVESPKGVSVSCNMVYRICQVWVSGWYSRKTSGLLGTMDEEPTSDMTLSNGRKPDSIPEMVKSFDVSDDSSPENCPVTDKILTLPTRNLTEASKNAYTCDRVFASKMSSLQPCFSTIPVDPYLAMCSSTEDSSGSICRAAMSYASACKTQGVSVKVPSMCIKCDMNGEEMIDRDMKVISSPPAGSPTFRSTDVVFIIEAKDCNRALRTRRKIDVLAKSLEDEFIQNNFKENRYATVLFGGDGVLDNPHPVVHDNKIFTNAEEIGKHMASLAIGNGSQDIFNGIAYALHRLNFRPGASKTFILFPCSSCQPEHMKTMDYADIHYALMEQGVTLHVMLQGQFVVDSQPLTKSLYGLDNSLIYTKADGARDRLKGEATSRRQVKVSRKVLGYCTALALQTNGTVFNGKKLYNKRENTVQLFTKVVSRRIVLTSSPADCQTCYCTRNDDDGVGKIECYVCGYPRYNSVPEDEDNFHEGTESLLSQNPINTIPTSDTEPDEGYDDGISEEDDDE